MNVIQTLDNKFLVPVTAGPWEGYEPANVIQTTTSAFVMPPDWSTLETFQITKAVVCKETAKPAHRWRGHKISMAQVREILAFFEWTYAESKSESMVHGFYHDDYGWQFLALPQKGRGMTAELLPDHVNRLPTLQRLPDVGDGFGWQIMSTWHHHCTSSAFQSGVDHGTHGDGYWDGKGELTKEGLHLTIGCLDKDSYDLDARTSFRKVMLSCRLADWFELDEVLMNRVPAEMHDYLLKLLLCQKAQPTGFPDWWKENYVKDSPPSWTQMGFQSGVGVGSPSGYSPSPVYSGQQRNADVRLPAHYSDNPRLLPPPPPETTLDDDIDALMWDHTGQDRDRRDLYEALASADFDFYADLVRLCDKYRLTQDELLDRLTYTPPVEEDGQAKTDSTPVDGDDLTYID